MLALLQSPESWIAFATLSLLETVLGVDNVIFLSILVARLPSVRQRSARIVGLLLAMLTRLVLLCSVVWLTRLTAPLFSVLQRPISGRDLILGAGGLFLLGKSATEIHNTLEGAAASRPASMFGAFHVVVIQIALIDVVFSLDSVFTAVGLARPDQLPIMAAAIVASIVVMMWLSGPIAAFVARHPSMKVLALAFLVLIGAALVCEALEFEVPKGYLYFAMAFSVVVELVNIRLRRLLSKPR
ncbi:MAG TPA: TerC family protein [Steroidobacteraceae bacterium]|jgi:predicted tellurium resistance membrane protein TerC|nr:TerC family protein [Steroidobacteraceae bacterium]